MPPGPRTPSGAPAGPTAALATDGAETDWAAAWPPPGASPLDLSDGYGRLADAGYGYGPAFRGLRAAWRAGDDLYAEVRLPAAVAAEGSLIHPALLDAVLHPLVLEAPGSRLVPFAFSAAEVACAGTDALRVRLSREGDRVRLTLRDTRNRPVGRVFVALRHAAVEASARRPRAHAAADAPETGTPVPERAPGEDPSGRVPEPRKEHGAGAGTVAPTGAEGFTPESLLELVREKAADLLGHGAPEEVEIDKPFTDLGFDSMGAVELQDHLEMATGLPLAATLVFDHPTVADVAAHLTELLGSATPSAADDGPAAPDPALARLREALDDVTALKQPDPRTGPGPGTAVATPPKRCCGTPCGRCAATTPPEIWPTSSTWSATTPSSSSSTPSCSQRTAAPNPDVSDQTEE